MWDYFYKSELLKFGTDFYYIIEVREKDGRILLKNQLDFDIEQAEIEFKKTVNEYRDSAHCIVLSRYVVSGCSTKKNAQLAVKDLKKIYPNYTIFENEPFKFFKFKHYPIAMIREVRSYYPKINKEFFAPDYWGLDKPNK